MNETKKLTVIDAINQAARAGAKLALEMAGKQQQADLYHAVESLLFAYPRLKRLALNPDLYGFFPKEYDHSVTVAPPPGATYVDKMDLADLYVESRRRSFARTLERFIDIDAIVKLLERDKRFIVIQMYYFHQDAAGNDRGEGAKRYTWQEIADELCEAGIECSEQQLRNWRSLLVSDMTVLLFGREGAVFLNSAQPRNKKGKVKDSEDTDVAAADPETGSTHENGEPGLQEGVSIRGVCPAAQAHGA